MKRISKPDNSMRKALTILVPAVMAFGCRDFESKSRSMEQGKRVTENLEALSKDTVKEKAKELLKSAMAETICRKDDRLLFLPKEKKEIEITREAPTTGQIEYESHRWITVTRIDHGAELADEIEVRYSMTFEKEHYLLDMPTWGSAIPPQTKMMKVEACQKGQAPEK